MYNKYNLDREIHNERMEKNEIKQMHLDVEKEYFEAVSELEEMKGNNMVLNELIDKQKAELHSQKKSISNLLKSSK